MQSSAKVAVIGAGFSGVLTALRLLLDPDGPVVVLIERGPRFARGGAFSTTSPHHLLNVRAANMSAFVEDPRHFLDWLADEAAGQAFVTRDQYGRYLQALLRRAASGDGARRLVLEHDEVMTVSSVEDGWALRMGVGKVLRVDAVVLALGHQPPPPPPGLDPALTLSPRYWADPWTSEAPPLGARSALLVGAGLTAVDLTLSLQAARPGMAIAALSRHGLAPRPHGEAAEVEAAPAEPPRGGPLALLRQTRRAAGGDWRAAIDALRPQVQSLWRRWSRAEQGRFLRHLKPWWDVHRHRMAPAVASRIDSLQADGRLRLEAGRLLDLRAETDTVVARWIPRGSREIRREAFDLVVNCAGPQSDASQWSAGLIGQMLEAGQVRCDFWRLGLEVDGRSRVVDADGRAHATLFAVGPVARGHFYEVVSVADIRLQAAECAEAVVAALSASSVVRAAAGSGALAATLAAELSERIAEIDVELASLKFAGRLRNGWELRGQRRALGDIALWLDQNRPDR